MTMTTTTHTTATYTISTYLPPSTSNEVDPGAG
jgi:hypothetical protein